MRTNKEIRNYTESYIKELGLEKFKRELSNSINRMSKGGDAISNAGQIFYYTRVLLHIRQTY